jgi:methylmalonyl-CoA/ethylmalonyl-CoA epimerase
MSDEDSFRLGQVGQIVIGVADIDRSRDFYGRVLGLRELWANATASVYDCGEVRLVVEARADHATVRPGSPIYFRVDDLGRARRGLEARGVVFTQAVDLGGELGERELWLAHFRDPDGHRLALMMEIPKGFSPQ